MRKMSSIVILAVIVLVAVSGIGSYNDLVGANENVDAKWSRIETQLQRRADLIPNLVNTVKGYAAHEQQAVQAVADARAKLAEAQSPAAKGQADGELNSALGRLLMIVENYPDLKADATFRSLMNELSGTENRIAVARKDYNNSVQFFNSRIRSFPATLYARAFGFNSKEYFRVDEGAKQALQVKF